MSGCLKYGSTLFTSDKFSFSCCQEKELFAPGDPMFLLSDGEGKVFSTLVALLFVGRLKKYKCKIRS